MSQYNLRLKNNICKYFVTKRRSENNKKIDIVLD